MSDLPILEKRLADFVLENEKKTSYLIEKQFPSLYRENGRELIDLVKSYYEFLENDELQSVYNIRKIYQYRNIDTTLEKMLFFFKTKFLNGLFFEEDIRFIIKHILDLYRRKGSKEGIELFFKLFFESEVEVYYPSQDMFKPSTSQWKIGTYIQLYSTTNLNIFSNLINKKIFGDKSNASAFVDQIYFINVNNAYVPVIFLSEIKGEFIGFDTIYTTEPYTIYGRVYGSLRSVEIEKNIAGTGGHEIGQIVEIRSDNGFGAKGLITQVSKELSGEIEFSIEDGNYGYTLNNTDILISDQNAFFNNNESLEFFVNERVRQLNSSNTEVFATIIGKNSDAIGLYLDYSQLNQQKLFISSAGGLFNPNEEIKQTNSFGIEVFGNVIEEQPGYIIVELDKTQLDSNSERYFFERNIEITTINRIENISVTPVLIEDNYRFENGFDIETIERDFNISFIPVFTTATNYTAKVDIGSITNTENVELITDIIENYLDVTLDSLNYSDVPPALAPMSAGANTIVDITTPLNEAFVPETFVIGEIATLSNINPGLDYVSDVFVFARENFFKNFNLQNQILNVTIPPGVVLFIGDIITQTKTVQLFGGSTVQTIVRGEIVNIQQSDITVKQRTFESFITTEPIFKLGSTVPITVNSRGRDVNSLPLGMNAVINGDVETVTGKIQEIKVIDSGIGYENDSSVELINITRESETIDIIGTAKSRRQGITEGTWITFESHINREKVLQDSFFYQDYSYEITTSIQKALYEKEFIDVMHPSGLKLFTKFGKIDLINIDIEVFNFGPIRIIGQTLEDNNIIYISNGFQYLMANSIIED
jgi:hypothetical protein